MMTLLLAVLLAADPSAPAPESYEAVYQSAMKTGKPVVVFVSTDWCPPCITMKKTILPKVREHGLFRKVAFAFVNPDHRQKLAQTITGGGLIPQFIVGSICSQPLVYEVFDRFNGLTTYQILA